MTHVERPLFRGPQSRGLILDPRIRMELDYTDNAAPPITKIEFLYYAD